MTKLLSIKQTIMKRDGISSDLADELIAEARSELQDLIDEGDFAAAEDICRDHFGLEPDYLMELIPI